MDKNASQKNSKLIKIRKKIGEKIRRRRLAIGMERKQLAEKLSVSEGTVSNFETGRHSVSAERLWIISAALGCSPNELYPPMPQDYCDLDKKMQTMEDEEAKEWLKSELSPPIDL